MAPNPVFTVDTAGNVGVGGSPTTKLQVFGGDVGLDTGQSVRWGGVAGQDTIGVISGTHTVSIATAGANRFFFDGSGRLGVGATPSYAVDVTGDVNLTGVLRQNGVNIIPNNVVVHPAGSPPVSTGHVLGFLDQNWGLTGDFYGITSSDPQAAPTYILISGTPVNETISITISGDLFSAQVISFSSTTSDTPDSLANKLIAAINANATLIANHLLPGKDVPTGQLEVGSFWNNIPVFSNYTSTGTTATITPPVARTTLSAAITNSQTTITVPSASGFPSSGNYPILVNQETMFVTGGQGTTTWTVTRGYAGSTAASHSNGTNVFAIAHLDAAPQWYQSRYVTNRPGQSNDIVAYNSYNGNDDSNTARNCVVQQYQMANASSTAFQGGMLFYTGGMLSGSVQNILCMGFANGIVLGDANGNAPGYMGYGTIDVPGTGGYFAGGTALIGAPSSTKLPVLTANNVTNGVNNITVTTATTANHPSISATGSDANLNLVLTAKGNGVVYANNSISAPGLTVAQSAAATNTVITIDNSAVPGGYDAEINFKNSARSWLAGAFGASNGLDSNGAFGLFDATAGGSAWRYVVDSAGHFRINSTAALTGSDGQVSVAHSNTTNGIVVKPSADSSFPLLFLNATGTAVGNISQNGTSTTYATSSDARLKRDFTPLIAGEIIDRLNPGRFVWDHVAGGIPGVGFRAQELHQVVPEATVPGDDAPDARPDDPDFRMWATDLSKLVPYLVAEIKALRGRVAALEEKVATSRCAVTAAPPRYCRRRR